MGRLFHRARAETLIDLLAPERRTRVVEVGANPINANPYGDLLADHDWQRPNWQHDEAFLERALTLACRCGAHAVTRPGAYAALPRREDVIDS